MGDTKQGFRALLSDSVGQIGSSRGFLDPQRIGGEPLLASVKVLAYWAGAAVPDGFWGSILMSLKFRTVLNSRLNSPKFCHR